MHFKQGYSQCIGWLHVQGQPFCMHTITVFRHGEVHGDSNTLQAIFENLHTFQRCVAAQTTADASKSAAPPASALAVLCGG